MNQVIAATPLLVGSLIVGCATLGSTERDRALLLEVDREWAATVESRDVERIVFFWSDDATVLPPGAPAVKGKAAIRAFVKDSHSIPGFRVTWIPEQASVSGDGTMGYTTGTNELTIPGPDGKLTTVKGRYVTVWRRDSSGEWKCVFDTWNSEPEK